MGVSKVLDFVTKFVFSGSGCVFVLKDLFTGVSLLRDIAINTVKRDCSPHISSRDTIMDRNTELQPAAVDLCRRRMCLILLANCV